MVKSLKNNILRRVLLILLLICLTTVGCSRANDNHPMYWNNVSAGMAPPLWLACSTEKSQLEFGEDLEAILHFRYPTDYDNYMDQYKPTNIQCTVGIAAKDKNFDFIPEKMATIKEYDSLTSDMYQSYYRGDILYNAALESICVPSDWFCDSNGAIAFLVDMYVTFPDRENQTHLGCAISLCYKKTDKRIQLFASYYDYKNYQEGCA